MRKELDQWPLVVPGEPNHLALARFLIGFEELRARLNPQAYPNLELSDEGHLWFNVVSLPSTWEVLAFPFGLGDLPGPALAVSFPHRPSGAGAAVLERLVQAVLSDAGSIVFAAHSSREEILEAYGNIGLPPLHLLLGKERVLAAYWQREFWSYCGVYLPVGEQAVGDAERAIRRVLSGVMFN